MTARNMNASATDFRLWLKPTVLLIETVNRLAARVKTRRTNHDNNPSLVKKGNLTVAIKPKHTNNNPRLEMPVNRTVLFQFLFSLIVILSLPGQNRGRRPLSGAVSALFELRKISERGFLGVLV